MGMINGHFGQMAAATALATGVVATPVGAQNYRPAHVPASVCMDIASQNGVPQETLFLRARKAFTSAAVGETTVGCEYNISPIVGANGQPALVGATAYNLDDPRQNERFSRSIEGYGNREAALAGREERMYYSAQNRALNHAQWGANNAARAVEQLQRGDEWGAFRSANRAVGHVLRGGILP